MHTGGLSSREGLAHLIHDGYRDGKLEIPPIDDKRLFIVESEFSNVLAQARRDGNTLSASIRDVWDGISIKPATKACQIWASDPHIALHGCITPSELRSRLSSADVSNGFANRFLIVWSERIGEIPFPCAAPESIVSRFAEEFTEIIRHGLLGYPTQKRPVPLILSDGAKAAYASCYREFRRPHPRGELISGLLVRRAPTLLRIAGLLAISDLATEISVGHIEAARAWIKYSAESAELVFSPNIDVKGEARRKENAEKLDRWLQNNPGWRCRADISTKCFMGHQKSEAIDDALERLTLDGRIERQEVDGGGAKMRTEYRIKPS